MITGWAGLLVALATVAAQLPTGRTKENGGGSPPQMPDRTGWAVSSGSLPLADDWQCAESGPVDDITLWVSWKGDTVGDITGVSVAVYEGDRSGPFNKPGTFLWHQPFGPNDITVLHWGTGDVGWHDPDDPGGHIEHDHQDIYQINIEDIDAKFGAFYQNEGTIYWLQIIVWTASGDIGWHTSLDHFEGNAVYWRPASSWQALTDPISGLPIDFAFVLNPWSTSLTLDYVNGEWGDVLLTPEPNDANTPQYPLGTLVTLLAVPTPGKAFRKWEIYNPNYPGDANYAAKDANYIASIVMNADREVTANFKCAVGMEPFLPMTLGAFGLAVWFRRRR